MARFTVKLVLPALFVLSALAAGCGGRASKTPVADTSTSIATARVHARTWPSTFEAGGIVRARTTATIASRMLAPVMTVHVHAGDHVRRGAPLVTLEAREMTATQARAQAASSGSDDEVRAAEATVRSADAALTFAQATHDRVRTLFEKRSATAHELDQARAARDEARAQLASARSGLAAATAARAAAAATAEAASAALSYSTLIAPFDGIVTERAVDPGDMAVPGAPLLTMEDPRAARLDVTLDEARAAFVSRSRPAKVRLGDGDDATWVDAVIAEIARVDPASHSFLIKLDLPAGVHPPSGSFGRARFEGPARRGLLIPASAAIRRGQLTFVYVVDDEHRVRLQPISTGTQVDDRLEVLAGLAEDARIVSEPPVSLVDGARITEGTR
jgi:multidrug efflux pump subunit AcrA (membrane-fusion protein)